MLKRERSKRASSRCLYLREDEVNKLAVVLGDDEVEDHNVAYGQGTGTSPEPWKDTRKDDNLEEQHDHVKLNVGTTNVEDNRAVTTSHKFHSTSPLLSESGMAGKQPGHCTVGPQDPLHVDQAWAGNWGLRLQCGHHGAEACWKKKMVAGNKA